MQSNETQNLLSLLPAEIWTQIVEESSSPLQHDFYQPEIRKNLANLRLVCKDLETIATDDNLWYNTVRSYLSWNAPPGKYWDQTMKYLEDGRCFYLAVQVFEENHGRASPEKKQKIN